MNSFIWFVVSSRHFSNEFLIFDLFVSDILGNLSQLLVIFLDHKVIIFDFHLVLEIIHLCKLFSFSYLCSKLFDLVHFLWQFGNSDFFINLRFGMGFNFRIQEKIFHFALLCFNSLLMFFKVGVSPHETVVLQDQVFEVHFSFYKLCQLIFL